MLVKGFGWSKLGLVCLLLVTVACVGCKGGKKDTPINTDMTNSGSAGPESSSGDGLPGIDQESILWNPNSGLQMVYFDYDSFALRSDAMATLKDNADKIKQVPNVLIQIEGHCDERGTQEYNLALGEKRALAVREHLMKLGISGDRLVTISYGEENPAVDGHDESAYKMNRRAVFNKAM